jgi:hypothetical protein
MALQRSGVRSPSAPPGCGKVVKLLGFVAISAYSLAAKRKNRDQSRPYANSNSDILLSA